MPATTGMHGMIKNTVNDLMASNKPMEVNKMENEKIKEIDLGKIQSPILRELVESGVITEQGVRVMGNGIIIKELVEINQTAKKILNSLYHLESKVEALGMKH